MMKLFEFEGTAKVPIDDKDIVSVWTDGIGISSDHLPHCAYKLIEGKKYKITISEVSK